MRTVLQESSDIGPVILPSRPGVPAEMYPSSLLRGRQAQRC